MSDQAMLELTAYELANYLVKHGQVEKASGILKDLIVKDPKAVTARCVCALAQIAYECKSWPDAEALWRVAAGAEPSNIEAWIKLAHSLVEIGRQTDAEGCVSKAKSLMACQPQDAGSSKSDGWLGGVHEQICMSFLGNALPKAMELTNLFSLPGTYLGSVTNGQDSTCFRSPLHDDEIHRRLDTALQTWEANGRTVPYLQQQGITILPKLIQGFPPRKKVLLALRKYFLGRADSREHEFGVFFQNSAQAVGLEPIFFPADPFLNPTSVPPERQYAELDRLGRTILSAKPDLVIFDDLCNQDPTGEYLTPEVYRNVFRALKQQHPFKLVGLYPDAWTTQSLSTMGFVTSFLDVLWPLTISPSADGAEIPGVKIFRAPIPYPESLFQVGPVGKDIGAAFVGSLFDYNSPRGVWLTLIKSRRIPCQFFLSTHTTSGSQAGAKPEEYAQFMSRLKVSVNFSARATGKKIMTGRAWESIIARGLLLEEDNEEIKRFFVPFVHYIPFKTINELQVYLSFFERNEGIRRTIAERAFNWFKQVYSKERIWRELISTALE